MWLWRMMHCNWLGHMSHEWLLPTCYDMWLKSVMSCDRLESVVLTSHKMWQNILQAMQHRAWPHNWTFMFVLLYEGCAHPPFRPCVKHSQWHFSGHTCHAWMYVHCTWLLNTVDYPVFMWKLYKKNSHPLKSCDRSHNNWLSIHLKVTV
jgi:hypothetical protein